MEEKILNTKWKVYTYSELSAEDKALVEEAKAATDGAHVPYSHFCVGAAVRNSKGQIFRGSNQENVSFPAGCCAERVTMHYAHAFAPTEHFTAIAVAARSADTGKFIAKPISPCGVCRQAMVEYEKIAGAPLRIILYGASEIYVIEEGVKALLPFCFDDF